MAVIARRGIVEGWVQGVGFRWTAKEQAGALHLLGYARNKPNGSVELFIQGEQVEIESFIFLMNQKKTFPGTIDTVVWEDVPSRNFKDFSVY